MRLAERKESRTAKRPIRAGRFATALASVLVLCGWHCLAAAADGFGVAPWQLYHDANPFVAASGLPFAPPAAAPDSWRVEAALSTSNTELAFDRGAEHLLYDSEAHEVHVAITRAFGERWLLRATLGGETFGNGFLDSFIEGFHRTFGFSNGDRGRLGSDGHTILYDDGSNDRITLDRNRRPDPFGLDPFGRCAAFALLIRIVIQRRKKEQNSIFWIAPAHAADRTS